MVQPSLDLTFSTKHRSCNIQSNQAVPTHIPLAGKNHGFSTYQTPTTARRSLFDGGNKGSVVLTQPIPNPNLNPNPITERVALDR